MNKHLIIDGNNIANICYFRAKQILKENVKDELKKFVIANPHSSEEIKNEKKEKLELAVGKYLPNFTVQVFINKMNKILKDNRTNQFYFVWDSPTGSKWRKKVYPEYKANRNKNKEDDSYASFFSIIDILKMVLNNYPLYQLEVQGAEGDDIIYSLCSILAGDKIKVISADGDMVQLHEQFDRVGVWSPKTQRYHQSPEYDIILYKSIAGDTSDNIKGVKGYGPKKTIKAMNEGLTCFNPEQMKIIETCKLIVDLSKNPNLQNNTQKATELLQNYKISVNTEGVRSILQEFKIKSLLKKFDSISSLLNEIGSNYGAKKES